MSAGTWLKNLDLFCAVHGIDVNLAVGEKIKARHEIRNREGIPSEKEMLKLLKATKKKED